VGSQDRLTSGPVSEIGDHTGEHASCCFQLTCVVPATVADGRLCYVETHGMNGAKEIPNGHGIIPGWRLRCQCWVALFDTDQIGGRQLALIPHFPGVGAFARLTETCPARRAGFIFWPPPENLWAI
jgi:hypothetical protein